MLSYSLIFVTVVAFASAQVGFQTVNIIIVADTGKLFSHYQNDMPSRDHQNPTRLGSNEADYFAFMVTTKDRVIAGQATANLTLRAKAGEPIRFIGMSESANMDDAIVVYNITRFRGDDITSKAVFNVMRKGSVQPIEDSDTFPVVDLNVDHDFWPTESSIKRRGTAVYKVRFGMYHRRNQGDEQKLFGFYEFLATLNVSF